MKKITFLFAFLMVGLGFSQTNLESFEGTAPSTTLFDGFMSATVAANPDSSMGSGNESANVLELITSAAGQPWQGAKLVIQDETIDMTTADKTMTVDIYSTTAVEFLVKLSDGDVGGTDANQESKTAVAHTGSGWETLTLDFNVAADTGQPGYNPPNDKFGSIVFFPLFNIGTDGWNPAAMTTTYIDNVTAIAGGVAPTCNDGVQNGDETGVDCGGTNCAPCAVPPATPAPTPPNRNPADVISIYSDAYTDIGVDTYDTPWCPGTTTEVMIGGNATQLLTGASCDGIDWQSSRTVDATAMTHFHIDFYTDDPDVTTDVFNLKFSQWGGTGGEVSALEFNINNGTTPGLATGTWVSVDIDLTEMPLNPLVAGSLDRDDIVQFVFTTTMNNVWWDNLYLHNNQVLSTEDFEAAAFNVFPNPAKDAWNISSSSTITNVAVFDILGKQVISITPDSNEATLNASSLRTGVYFARIDGVNGSKTIKLVKN